MPALWTHTKAKVRHFHRRGLYHFPLAKTLLNYAPLTLALCVTTPAYAISTEWIGPDQGVWSDTNNWSNGLPNSGIDTVINATGSITTIVNSTAYSRDVSLAADDTILLQALLSTNGTITNAGAIVIDGGALAGSSAQSLNGFGTVQLIKGGVLVVGSSNNTLYGSGTVSLVTNVGTITATSPSGYLLIVGHLTNQGTITANGGALVFNFLPRTPLDPAYLVDNTNGLISVHAGSSMMLNFLNATGGTVSIHNGGLLQLHQTTLNNVHLQTYGGTLALHPAGPLTGLAPPGTISGTLTNTGNLLVDAGTTYHASLALEIINSGEMLFRPPPPGVSGTTTLGTFIHNTGSLRLAPSRIHTNATSIINDGTIIIDATLSFTQNLSITGSGRILLTGASSTLLQNFTSSPSQSDPLIFTMGQSISGRGFIGDRSGLGDNAAMIMVNTGTITAKGGVLTITPRTGVAINGQTGFHNRGLLMADGGTLQLAGPSFSTDVIYSNFNTDTLAGSEAKAIHNSTILIEQHFGGGLITVEDTSVVRITGGVSGTINQTGPASKVVFSVNPVDIQPYLANSILNGNSTIEPGTLLSVLGQVEHSGTMTVKSLGSTPPSGIRFGGSTTLTGGGTILLTNGSTSRITCFPSVGNSLTSDNSIYGAGAFVLAPFDGTFTNNGVVEATGWPGFTIDAANLPAAIVNNGALRANGGVLILNGSASTTYANTGLIEAMPGNSVLVNVTVVGGTFSSQGLIEFHKTPKVNQLLIATDTSGNFTGKVNLKNPAFVLQTSDAVDKEEKLNFLTAALASGLNGGDWLGLGITSSTVAADHPSPGSGSTSLALFDNAVMGLPAIGGMAADSNSLFITTALIGDANFDQVVNQTDFDIVVQNWQTLQTTWSAGDLNFDGFVDLLDAVMVARHAQEPLEVGAYLQAYVPVPEPGTLVMLLAGGGMLLARRRVV